MNSFELESETLDTTTVHKIGVVLKTLLIVTICITLKSGNTTLNDITFNWL
jgi:hypothetical protein